MAVYVDDVRHAFGRMVMCHLWADSRDELFAMVDKIGVQRKWFQRPDDVKLPGMNASWEHFDIALSKKSLAIKHGALLTDIYGPMYHVAKLNGHQKSVDGVLRTRRARGLPDNGIISATTPQRDLLTEMIER